MSGDFYKKVAANDMESANPESKHQTATQPRRLRFGEEEQRHERALTFEKNRSKRYKACSDVVRVEGLEPPASCSQRDAEHFFRSFIAVFGAF